MAEAGARPGGLTALAVINFVFGGLGVIRALYVMMLPVVLPWAQEQAGRHERDRSETRAAQGRDELPLAESRRRAAGKKEEERLLRAVKENPKAFVLDGGVSVLLAVLMVVGGVGYLKLKRGLGRGVGILYALLSMGWSSVEFAWLNKRLETDFSLLGLVSFIYPAVTLLCLWFVFRDDFTNP